VPTPAPAARSALVSPGNARAISLAGWRIELVQDAEAGSLLCETGWRRKEQISQPKETGSQTLHHRNAEPLFATRHFTDTRLQTRPIEF